MQAEFIALDPQGVITRETWIATRAHCPQCGAGPKTTQSVSVWALTDPVIKINETETRVFLCIHCQHTSYGLNGFKPRWNVCSRVEQIFKHGIQDARVKSSRLEV